MTEPNRFFLWLYRLLALLAVLVLAMVAWFIAQQMFGAVAWQPRRTVQVRAVEDAADAPARRMWVGEVRAITGARTTMISMHEGTGPRAGLGSLGSGGRGAGPRNLVFVVEGQARARWLFARNHQWLRDIDLLCLCETGTGAGNERILAIFVQVVRAGADADGAGPADGPVVPALLRPDGSGYTELGGPVDAIIDATLSEEGERLGLLLVDGARLLRREYTLADFALRSEQVLTELER